MIITREQAATIAAISNAHDSPPGAAVELSGLESGRVLAVVTYGISVVTASDIAMDGTHRWVDAARDHATAQRGQ